MYENLTSEVYSSIVSRKNIIIEYVDKWEQELNCDLPLEDLYQQFRGIYCVTNSAKLRSFQFNILHYTSLVLNEYVFKKKHRNTKLSTFCNVQVETLTHFFWECILVQSFWRDVLEIIPKVCYVNPKDCKINVRNILFNEVHNTKDNVTNFIILVAKYNFYM